MKTFSAGFWIISIALVLSFSIPCYAQVETELFLTPEGTAWKFVDSNPKITLYIVFLSDHIWLCGYSGCGIFNDSQYQNRLISKFTGSRCFYYPVAFCSTLNGYVIPLLRYGIIKYCSTEGDCYYWPLIRDDNFTFVPYGYNEFILSTNTP